MKIVIPMSGVGRRFQDAGYRDPKPLIKVDGKPIIEHVVGMFPGETDFIFICSEAHLQDTPMRSILERLAPRGRIVPIAPHKKGPVHAVLQAVDLIADDEPVVVNYCDFSVEWDWPTVAAELRDNGCDGAVPAYRGFHPHCLGSTNYAYMRDLKGWMLEIQEKKPFTSERMKEYASSGTYYFKKGSTIKRYFAELSADPAQALNGEYYVSLVYNLLVRDGLKVFIPEIPVMLQWGTPQDLEEYQSWSDYFFKESAFQPQRAFEGQILVPMAGAGSRFTAEGYALVKPLIPVSGEPMICKAAGSLPKMPEAVFVCRDEHLRSHPLEAVLRERFGALTRTVSVDHLTEGQACTCLLAKDLLDPAAPLMIGACDNGMVWDEEAFARLIADPAVDCVVWTFRGHPGARRNPKAYGWVRVDAQGAVTEVSVKQAISDRPELDPGVVGSFWFREARFFTEAAEELIRQGRRVNGEFYADSVINVLLEQGRRARIFDVGRYLCWGTPDDLRTWEYWEGHFQRCPRPTP
jgi:NDP-sugar pyrophosphorylase family protein